MERKSKKNKKKSNQSETENNTKQAIAGQCNSIWLFRASCLFW